MKRRLSDSIFALSVSECRLTASNLLPPVAASMISFFWRSTFSCRFRSKASMLLSDSSRVTKGSFSFSNGLGSMATTSWTRRLARKRRAARLLGDDAGEALPADAQGTLGGNGIS